MQLKGSKTHGNLKAAFAGESQANRRYLYFANKADVEGQNDVSALFRSTAEGETGHAHGHLDYLAAVGDPATDLPIGRTRENLKASVAGETHEYTDMYPGMAKAAREEGFAEIADWFETLAKAVSRSGTHRVLMEHAAGIHRDARLPEFATETFSAWIRRTKGIDAAGVSSVQYLTFLLSPEQVTRLGQDGAVVRVRIDHPAYQAQAVLGEETRRAIATDCR